MRILIIFLALILGPNFAVAADYPPGSVGYLYEDCKQVLAQAESLKDAHKSYCGTFAEGFLMGVMSSSSLRLPEPAPDDPCYEDKAREYARINNRFCQKLPTYNAKDERPEALIHAVVNLAEQWAEQNEGIFNEPVTSHLGAILQPGEFCDSLPAQPADMEVNPALLNVKWGDIFSLRKQVSHEAKYKECVADIKAFGDDPAAFKGSQCGAEILGFLAGLQASSHLDGPSQEPTPACKKQMERLYKSINPQETMCVSEKTHPLYVARVFAENYKLIRGYPGLLKGMDLFDPGALGAVGYETIYRGFMCRNEAEKKIKAP